jgi:hypothetical protein
LIGGGLGAVGGAVTAPERPRPDPYYQQTPPAAYYPPPSGYYPPPPGYR